MFSIAVTILGICSPCSIQILGWGRDHYFLSLHFLLFIYAILWVSAKHYGKVSLIFEASPVPPNGLHGSKPVPDHVDRALILIQLR